jgi:SAM-dependent methyltransferase
MKTLIFTSLIKLSKRWSRKGLNEFIEHSVDELSVGTHPDTLRALSIGAGGEVNRLIQQKNIVDLIQIDIDESRCPDFVMSATNLEKFEDQSFDVVFAFEVLEHIDEPQKAASEFHRVLKQGGRLYVSTPFTFGVHEAPIDFFRYTRFGLKKVFENFSEIKVSERNNYIETIIVLLMRKIMAPKMIEKLFGAYCILFFTLTAPFWKFLGKVVGGNEITTGLTLKAVK